MKKTTSILSALSLVGFLVSPHVCAQSEVILESFEDGIDSAIVKTIEKRTTEVSQHTKTGDDDLGVTHGEKALKVTLTGDISWGQDLDIELSEEASNLVKQAWATKAEARYQIRFDVAFPTESINWGNFNPRVNGWDYAQLEQGGQTVRRMAIPLDLVEADLTGDEPVIFQVVNQYDTGNGAESAELFVDNIRLVDTYVAGAVPEITLLNGFETDEDLAKVIPVSDRYELSLHKKTGADDVAVTEGESSLEIKINAGGGWTRDFTIPFKNTIMEQVARLPQEGRGRYTLRMDVIFEDRGGDNWNGNWQNFIARASGGGAQNFAMHRGGAEQHVRVLSLPLDQFELEPSDPDDPESPNPGISIVNQGAWNESGMTFHIDNIRLVDTGNAPLGIQDLVLNAEGKPAVTWKSSDTQSYAVETSSNLLEWTELVTGVLGEQGSEATTYVDGSDVAGAKYYRVAVAGAAPPLNEGFENGLNGWEALVDDRNSGTTMWEVGAPTNGPAAAKTGEGVAGTDLDANYTSGTWIALRSPEVDLQSFIAPPTLTFSYYLETGDSSAARVNILETSGTPIEEPADGDDLFFSSNTDGWQDVSVPLPAFGQKVILEFEFIGNGEGAGFFIDDVFIEAAE